MIANLYKKNFDSMIMIIFCMDGDEAVSKVCILKSNPTPITIGTPGRDLRSKNNRTNDLRTKKFRILISFVQMVLILIS
jgi:hypothetical protein